MAFISSLLGVAAIIVLQAAAAKDTPQVSVSVWPPGSNIYLGECLLLQCTVESNSSSGWSYRWSRRSHASVPAPNPRHLVSGNTYSITAVTKDDAGSYRCQAKSNKSSVVLFSRPTTFSVSELPVHSLTLTPSNRQVFRGERFTVRCPESQSNSSGWMLRKFSPGRRVRKRVLHTDWCSPLGGANSADNSDSCVFTAAQGHSGMYWCEGAEGRSNAVNITVSYGAIILKSPTFPVTEGNSVALHCHYWTSNRGQTTFFKNGKEIFTVNSSSPVVTMTVDNVTRSHEGFYKCASRDRKVESPESWLSVRPGRGNVTSPDGPEAAANGSWKWGAACGFLLLLLVALTVWFARHLRFLALCSRSCWPGSKEEVPAVELPATKQDATEVQWDLSWMEMSNLLDKQLYPAT